MLLQKEEKELIGALPAREDNIIKGQVSGSVGLFIATGSKTKLERDAADANCEQCSSNLKCPLMGIGKRTDSGSLPSYLNLQRSKN